MDLIEKIEIKSFRSFGNRKKNKTQIINLKDLNIFSGGNDSGKSNILRALNLFFNQNTNLNQFIDFSKDFFKPLDSFKDKFIEEEMITIKLYFWNKKNKNKNQGNTKSARLPEKFWVSRKWVKTSSYNSFNQDSGVFIALEKEKGECWKYFTDEKGKILPNVRANISKQLTDFLNSIQYHYVPAIKDTEYFSHLYGELQRTLLKESQSNVNNTRNEFEKALQNSTQYLMQEFKKVVDNNNLNINAMFELPDLINLFKTLNVQTGNDISLRYRGDGIQAKLIPEILYFIALKESTLKQSNVIKGEKIKKYFIWGFEEPENSYEYRNIKILSERFVSIFAKYAQIFITTHSKEFLALESKLTPKEIEIIGNKKLKQYQKNEKLEKLSITEKSTKISMYRVWKNDSTYNASQVVNFDDSKNGWENLAKDLGVDDSFIIQEARLVEDLQNKIQQQKEIIMKANLSNDNKEHVIKLLQENVKILTTKLLDAEEKVQEYEKICVFYEDSYLQMYKIAYLKLNDIDFSIENFEDKFQKHAPFIFIPKCGCNELNKFLDQVKLDEFNDKKIVGIFDFDDAYSKYDGLKSERWDSSAGNVETGLYRKRKDCDNVYAMLIPVPPERTSYASIELNNKSALESELLLTDDTLKKIKSFKEREIPRTNVKETYFDEDKGEFWKKLFYLNKDDFKNFGILFDSIKNIFENN